MCRIEVREEHKMIRIELKSTPFVRFALGYLAVSCKGLISKWEETEEQVRAFAEVRQAIRKALEEDR